MTGRTAPPWQWSTDRVLEATYRLDADHYLDLIRWWDWIYDGCQRALDGER